jgi:hypothetical protein
LPQEETADRSAADVMAFLKPAAAVTKTVQPAA